MGMFDYIKCHYDLPGLGKRPDLNFQTKSLDCLMDNYEIREDGTFWVERYGIEDRSDPNANGLEAFIGLVTRVNKVWELCTDACTVVFYGGPAKVPNPDKEYEWLDWWEFKAQFVDGKLYKVERTSWTVNSTRYRGFNDGK